MSETETPLLSGILYRTDLTKPDTDVILLGLVAEVHANHDGAIGLLVRKSLYPPELQKLDDIARVQFSNPPEYLIRVMEEAIEQHSRKILDKLAKNHEWALNFTAPISFDVPDDYADGDAMELVFGLLHQLLKEGPGPKLLELLPLGKQILGKQIVDSPRICFPSGRSMSG